MEQNLKKVEKSNPPKHLENLVNLQKSWRADEIFFRKYLKDISKIKEEKELLDEKIEHSEEVKVSSFSSVLLRSWPEESKEKYIAKIKASDPEFSLTTADLATSNKSNSFSHIQFIYGNLHAFIKYCSKAVNYSDKGYTTIKLDERDFEAFENVDYVVYVERFTGIRYLVKMKDGVLCKFKKQTQVLTLAQLKDLNLLEASWEIKDKILKITDFYDKFDFTSYEKGNIGKRYWKSVDVTKCVVSDTRRPLIAYSETNKIWKKYSSVTDFSQEICKNKMALSLLKIEDESKIFATLKDKVRHYCNKLTRKIQTFEETGMTDKRTYPFFKEKGVWICDENIGKERFENFLKKLGHIDV